MPAFLIVNCALQDGRFDAYRQPPVLDVGGLRAPLDWGDITLHVPAGDLPVTISVTRAGGLTEGAMLTVRAPAGTGTRLTFMPPMHPGGPSLLRIDGQWAADSSMHYYAARDARVLVQPTQAASSAPQESAARHAPTRTPAAPVGPAPGSMGSVPQHVSTFGREQGSRVDPIQTPGTYGPAGSPAQPAHLARPPHLEPQPSPGAHAHAAQSPSFGQRAEHGAQSREHRFSDRQPPPIPTPAEFHRLEQEAHDAQRRVYEAWQAQQHAQSTSGSSQVANAHDGAPRPIGLQGNAGQAAPAWYPDPFRRAEQRWFDGRQWTASVMRGGVRGNDQPG